MTKSRGTRHLPRIIRDAVAQKRTIKWGYVRQFGGLYPAECDSVAAHSNSVAALAIILASEYGPALDAATGVSLDLEKVALMATFHDYGEGRSGDTGASSYATRGVCNLHSLEREGLVASLEGLRISEQVVKLWDDYRAYRTPEAVLVHVADNLEGFEKALHAGHGIKEIRDDAFRILGENLEIYKRRADVAEGLSLVADFLVDAVLMPGITAIASAYGVPDELSRLKCRLGEEKGSMPLGRDLTDGQRPSTD